jgi:phage tail sheath protein FI
MPEYLSPGVYVEEVDTGSKPIEGVSTSTVGMVGVAGKGIVKGLPRLVTSFADFKRKFVGYLSSAAFGDHRFLPYAVEGLEMVNCNTCMMVNRNTSVMVSRNTSVVVSGNA